MELIWCPPGSFIMGPTWIMGGRGGAFAHPVTLTKGILSWKIRGDSGRIQRSHER